MARDTITFQLGTHYLSRVALRVERLLFTIKEASLEKHPVIHNAALNDLFEIIKLTEKPELKGRFLQEFIRIEHALNKSSELASGKPLFLLTASSCLISRAVTGVFLFSRHILFASLPQAFFCFVVKSSNSKLSRQMHFKSLPGASLSNARGQFSMTGREDTF